MSIFATCGANCARQGSRMSFTQSEALATNSRSLDMSRQWHRVWPLNIRAQMMLWYFLIFAILIFLFGAVFYFNLKTSLETNVDTELKAHAQEIASGIYEENGVLDVEDITGVLPGLVDPDAQHDATPSTSTTATNQGHPHQEDVDVDISPLVRILNNDGKAVYASPAFGNLDLPSISVTQSLQGDAWEGTVTAKDGLDVRLYSLPLLDKGKVYAVLQVGESLTSLSTTLRS